MLPNSCSLSIVEFVGHILTQTTSNLYDAINTLHCNLKLLICENDIDPHLFIEKSRKPFSFNSKQTQIFSENKYSYNGVSVKMFFNNHPGSLNVTIVIIISY